MTPDQLAAAVRAALLDIAATGSVALTTHDIPDPVHLERPRSREHGDWATNVALQLAKVAGTNPRALAVELVERLGVVAGVGSADVAGPGFVNIRLEAAAAGELARTVVEAGHRYGNGDALAGLRVNLEFVSANPTGPLHIGGARWAAVGDSLARVMAAAGADVTREYYFNDHGTQIDKFARSLLARARGEEPPEDGYHGQYVIEIANRVVADVTAAGGPDPAARPTCQGCQTCAEHGTCDQCDTCDAPGLEVFASRGVPLMFDEIKTCLHGFGVDFDVYFHEESLHTCGAVERAVARLREAGHIYQADGATWLRTTTFGDDKDRVVVKSDGNAAYIAGDIAYYLDKRERGFDRVVLMLGADHHGYVGRLMAVCAAFGDTPHVHLEILIGQLVNLLKDGEPVRMGKRAGNVVTLDDLVDAVGVDAARYALARSSYDTSIDLDLDLLVKAANDNPVYKVQYAHARTCSVDRNAAEAGVRRDDGFDAGLLAHRTENAVLGLLADFPRVVEQAATLREPHRVARYAEAVAGAYHKWYDFKLSDSSHLWVIPKDDDPVTDVHRTRLWMNDAVRQVLANALGLLGVTPLERM
ncbi:MAG: arginine--tRNA ligase [Micrococcales bacterium]|nr:arginine--tRNA ligase [Micrococcales bacterium]